MDNSILSTINFITSYTVHSSGLSNIVQNKPVTNNHGLGDQPAIGRMLPATSRWLPSSCYYIAKGICEGIYLAGGSPSQLLLLVVDLFRTTLALLYKRNTSCLLVTHRPVIN